MKPILKWIGGKRKLINEITALFPESYSSYYEPFVGGGAVFFAIEPENAIISDANEQLINFYKELRKNPEKLFHELRMLIRYGIDKDTYLKVRSWDRHPSWNHKSNTLKAARFIYLNRLSFSGMWRVNRSGQMNVPYGNYIEPSFPTMYQMRMASELLYNKSILCCSYDRILPSRGSLVYLDPPYMPVSETSSYTGYTRDGFSYGEQESLFYYCQKLDRYGVYFILSNSYNEHILDLYREYNIKIIKASRSVSTRWKSERKVKEILVSNT